MCENLCKRSQSPKPKPQLEARSLAIETKILHPASYPEVVKTSCQSVFLRAYRVLHASVARARNTVSKFARPAQSEKALLLALTVSVAENYSPQCCNIVGACNANKSSWSSNPVASTGVMNIHCILTISGITSLGLLQGFTRV